MSLKEILKFFIPSAIQLLRIHFLEYRQWKNRLFNAPSPSFVKKSVLLRNGIPNTTWIETGTYLGDMTVFLAKHSTKIISIEPEPNLYLNAKKRCQNKNNIEIINGLSEKVLPERLPILNGDINFWLDGHYSEGITFKGPIDTPIIEELLCIENYIKCFNRLIVLIDDVRCFNSDNPENSGYPKLEYLVDWARKNNLKWHIEHDIFIAKNF